MDKLILLLSLLLMFKSVLFYRCAFLDFSMQLWWPIQSNLGHSLSGTHDI